MRLAAKAGLLLAVLAHAAGARADDAGTCMQASDCAVAGASCQNGQCTLLQTYEAYPDTSGLTEITLTTPSNLASASSSPDLVWSNFSGASIVAAAVFSSPPQFDPSASDAITNTYDIVWFWDSALPGASVSDAQVPWENGRGIQDATSGLLDPSALTSNAPAALSPGIYYWAVWGWTGSDYSLGFRSQVRAFVTGGDNLTGTSCGSGCESTAPARCASANYCVLACASQIDCFSGYQCDLSHLSSDNPFGVCHGSDTSCPCKSSSATCDPELQLCYGGDNAAAADCGCRAAGGVAGGEGAWWLLPGTIALTWLRRAARRRRGPSLPHTILNAWPGAAGPRAREPGTRRSPRTRAV